MMVIEAGVLSALPGTADVQHVSWNPNLTLGHMRVWSQVHERKDSTMNEIASAHMNAICEAIESLPGLKIVTLYAPASATPVMTIDVDGTAWGYHPGHYPLFRAKMGWGGAITVRHFLDDTIEVEGRTLPQKDLYGVRFSENTIHPVDVQELEWCCEHVVEGDEPRHIGREPGVRYKAFADLLHCTQAAFALERNRGMNRQANTERRRAKRRKRLAAKKARANYALPPSYLLYCHEPGFLCDPYNALRAYELLRRNGPVKPLYCPMDNILSPTVPATKYGKCYENVEHYVSALGGSMVHGWLWAVDRNSSARNRNRLAGHWLAAHVIWRTQSGQLVDITPRHPLAACIVKGFLIDDQLVGHPLAQCIRFADNPERARPLIGHFQYDDHFYLVSIADGSVVDLGVRSTHGVCLSTRKDFER